MIDQVTTSTPQVDTPVYLSDDSAPVITPSDDVADIRSQKADLGLGPTMQMSQADIRSQIKSGQEAEFRASAASNLQYQAAQRQEQKLIDLRNQKGGPLSYDEAMRVLDPYNPENKPADVRDVIEKAYAERSLGIASTASVYMQGNVLDRAAADIPQQTEETQNKASKMITRLEYAKTLRENVEDEIANQSWLGWGADVVKNQFQPYVEAKLRGLTPGVGYVSGGLGLGTNLETQGNHVFNIPDDNEYKTTLSNIVNGLKKDNPQLARQFLDYVVGVGTNEKHLDNIFTLLTPGDYAQGLKLSKTLARKILTYNEVNTAFKQIVEKAAKDSKEIPVKAAVEDAVGDVKSAAATRASDNISKKLTSSVDPVLDIKGDLTTNFRLDGDLIDTAPGPLSRDEATWLKDAFYKSGDNLFDRIVNILRVNRTPVPLASEQAVKAYQEAARAEHAGEGLLDVGNPIHDRVTNTYHIPYTFGDEEGRIFPDAETAYNYARKRGYAEPRVVEGTGDVLVKPAKPIMTSKDLNRSIWLRKNITEVRGILDTNKNFLSNKFVGPRSPEQIAAAKEAVKSYGDNILPAYEKELAEIQSRVRHSDPVIEQNGVGYKFTVIRPYKETDDLVRTWLTKDPSSTSTSSATGWSSWKNSVLGWVRGSDNTLSFNESLNRKIATYTQSALKEWAYNEAKEIEAIANQTKWYTPWNWYRKFSNREMFNQFNETLRFAKKVEDPKTGDLGYFFKTPQELDDHYQRFYGRSVSFPEVKAYFAHVKLLEGNRVLSEIAEFRNRARIGTEQHQIFLLGQDGTRMASGFFDGIEEKKFPQGGGQILIMGPHKGDERLYHLGANEIPGKHLEQFKNLVETGQAKVIRIYDPDSHPLSGFVNLGNERVRYVMTTDAEVKPLGFNHVNRRGGGHFDIDADHYVKQANVVSEGIGDVATDKRRNFKKIYVGDRTFAAAKNRAQGAEYAKGMTEMNRLMKAGETESAQALARKLGIQWDKIQEWYNPNRYINGKKVGAYIDWDEPFYVVPRNKRIFDIDKTLEERIGRERFQDASKTGSDALQFRVEYNQARDSEIVNQIKDVGSHGNPIYKLEHADYVDPIPSLNRALNRAIRSTFMDDYKISAVEHWLEEAMPHLKAEEKEVRSAPFYYFNNADYGAFKSAAGNEVISNLLSNRLKIQQFVGLPSKVETAIQGLTQHLADTFYTRFGPEESRNTLTKAVTVVPLRFLSRWQDPISGVRSLAFNSKLGLFSIPQFLVQSQTFANIWALGGRSGANGTMGAMLHQWSRINKSEGFMKAYDDLYTKMNLFGNKPRPGEFIEANRELAKTGFEHVGTEYQLADDAMQHKFIKNEWNNFLDAGQIFFREGEKFTRLGAWYTAFREFRHENPTKVITDADRAKILGKADLYTANMSRASAGAYNNGIFSLPMQFLTYQVRMAELFLGKRLGETVTQRALARARMLGVYAAMYGAPGALGVTGFPWSDSIRAEAINRGYVPGADKLQDGVMNGLLAWQMALISGKGDYQKGNQYDVQGRWGTQGMTAFRESMRSDKTIWSLIGGAGVDTFISTIAHVDPFWQFARQIVSDDEEGNKFKVTPAHFLDLFSEISSVDMATRGIYALHTGRWITKNQQFIEDATPADVLFREVTGLKTQDQTDIQIMRDIKKNEQEVQRKAEAQIVKDYRRGLDAVRDQDYDTAQTYFTNARARMLAAGIPVDRRNQIMASATKGYEPQTLTSAWDWATKHVPFGQEATRFNSLQQRLQLQEYRNQP